MKIESDEEIPELISDINDKIQALNDYLGDRNVDEAKIQFPRGYLRSCASHRNKYSFVKCPTLKSNIAYAKMTSDVLRWLLNRTNLSLSAKEMVIKQGVALMGSVAESVVKDFTKGMPDAGSKKSYKVRTEKLLEYKHIDDELKSELDWLWDIRNNVHLMLLDEKEYCKYGLPDYNRAVVALQTLRVSLGGKP